MTGTFKDILAHVAPTIRSWGFKGSGQNYRKVLERAVLVINFQKSAGGNQFYVNLGMQPLFVPTEGEAEPNPNTIKEYECIFRSRVDPPDGMSGWFYTMDASMLECFGAQLAKGYQEYLVPLATIPGPLTDAILQDFDEQSVHPLLGNGHARNFLHFSRIALATQQREKAIAFAQAGIERCPEKASRLRAHLEAVLTEVGA